MEYLLTYNGTLGDGILLGLLVVFIFFYFSFSSGRGKSV